MSSFIVVPKYLLFFVFFASGGGFPLCPEILQYTEWPCLSSEFFTVRDAGFAPKTTASVVWSAANEPPHHQYIISKFFQTRGAGNGGQKILADLKGYVYRCICQVDEQNPWVHAISACFTNSFTKISVAVFPQAYKLSFLSNVHTEIPESCCICA